MSKYSHFEMCEKIFGSRYKFDKVKELVPYSRTDMWDKMIEQQDRISDLETKLAESEESHHKNIIELTKIATEKDRKIEELKQKLEESEEQVKHWHDLYNERDKQFQSVRQRYHLLNKLQSNYDKKDKLHLAYMQCAELVDENEQLKQQLAEKDIKEVELREEIARLNLIINENKKEISGIKNSCDYYMNRSNDLVLKLAEKDKEIEELKQRLKDTIKIYSDEFVEKDKELKELRYKVKKNNQDKIEFAIAELEKVKEKFGYKYNSQLMFSSKGLCDYIDQQIKELRGE